MTSRPPGPRAPRRPPKSPTGPSGRPLTLAAAMAAMQSAFLGALAVMVVVLVGWATAADSDASATTAVKGALQVWLVGHGTRLDIPGGAFGLTPLGLTVIPFVLVFTSTLRTGRQLQVRGRPGVVALSTSVTATYALLGLLVATVAETPAVRPQPLSALLATATVAGLASAAAAIQAAGRRDALTRRLPALLRGPLGAAGAAVAAMLAVAALVAGLSLAAHASQARILVESLQPGAGGALLLLLGCLLYVPTAAVWSLGLLAGPGFALGAGTSVTLTAVDVRLVPAVPLLAAVPQDDPPAWAWLLLLVPVAAGVLAGLLLRRGEVVGADGPDRRERARQGMTRVALTGALAGLYVAALATLAAGPAGPGRLGHTGPDWWALGPAVAAEVALGAACVLGWGYAREYRRDAH